MTLERTMWQNLRNVRSIAEKIGNVVAPPVQDRDEYYEEDEDEDEDEDADEDESYGEDGDYGEEEAEEDEEDEPQQTTPRSPFGIVGLLTRAMDNEQSRFEKDEDGDNDRDIVRGAESDQQHQDYDKEAKIDSFQLQNSVQRHESPGENPEPLHLSNLSLVSEDLEPRAVSEKPTEPPNIESPLEPPKMLGLQRESGSISPISPNKKFVSALDDSEQPLLFESSVDAPSESPNHLVAPLNSLSKEASFEADPIFDAAKGSAPPGQDKHPTTSDGVRGLGATSSDQGLDSNESRTERLEKRCKELKRQLTQAQEEAERLKHSYDHDKLYQLFQEKEARLLEASNEEHEVEMNRLRNEMDETFKTYQESMIEERKAFSEEHDKMNALLQNANVRNKELETENQKARIALEKARSSQEQQHVRALRKIEDRLAQSMAIVDERNERIAQLQRTIKDLESHISKDRNGANEAEEEMEELHQENEALHGQLDEMQSENETLKIRLNALEHGADELVRVKMELRMLREEHSRVQAKAENVAATAVSNTAQLEQDRDEALAEVSDVQLRLSSIMADLEIVKADNERLLLSNNNLQNALEAFHSEREVEIAMIEAQKAEERDAVIASHTAELQAIKMLQQNELRQIQRAADDAVKNIMEEVKELEEKLESCRVENVQTRRALDEAINRLSQTQEDVVDRTVMKNILLDWLTKAGKKERSQVLEMMADLLHFTDDEKRRVHVDGRSPSIRNIMSPPPAKIDVKNLEGDNVREKWVNFLLAESSDSP